MTESKPSSGPSSSQPLMRTSINRLTDGQTIDQSFRLADKQLRVNRQGGKYLLLKLADRSGSIVAMMWNADDADFDRIQRGGYVHGIGRTQVHQGTLQVILTAIDHLDDDQVDSTDFDAFDSNAADTALEQLDRMLGNLSDVHLRGLGREFLNDDDFINQFRLATAAVSNHHAYPGGLLRHTVDLMELCTIIGPRYERIDVDRLVFGAFLHDLGKIEEISPSGEMSYTDRGQLVGHIVIGIQLLGNMIGRYERRTEESFPSELRMHLEHLIVSHHGQLEYGSPRLPATIEAIALHHIDNLDAKVTSFTSLIESDLANDENWTSYQPSIGRKLWKKQ